MSRRGHGRSAVRTVGYALTGPLNDALAERMLAQARAAGIVSQFDAGRGSFLWFNGWPGPALRAFRDRLAAAVGGQPERRP